MTICSLNSYYLPQYPQLTSGGFAAFPNTFSSLPSTIFSFGAPRYDVFSSNIFGFTPPTIFSYIPQLNNPFSYMGMLSFNSQLSRPLFSAPQFTLPQFSLPQVYTSNYSAYSSGSTSGLFGFLTSSRAAVSNTPARRPASTTRTGSFNTNSNLPSLRSVGYNTQKAQKLAQAALNESVGYFDGKCAKHVKTAIQDAGLGAYQSGHAHQVDTILSGNSNFREISAEGVDLKKLPAGCVLVYERGVSRYSSEYGHVEITLGDGTAVSGGRTRNLRPGAKIFVPV